MKDVKDAHDQKSLTRKALLRKRLKELRHDSEKPIEDFMLQFDELTRDLNDAIVQISDEEKSVSINFYSGKRTLRLPRTHSNG
jgi:hypothetical protein